MRCRVGSYRYGIIKRAARLLNVVCEGFDTLFNQGSNQIFYFHSVARPFHAGGVGMDYRNAVIPHDIEIVVKTSVPPLLAYAKFNGVGELASIKTAVSEAEFVFAMQVHSFAHWQK